uniref:O-antigen ligase family protein n=1 Tax=uncultured Leifsonia sp. TaxID=340359 RepID=UPI0028D74B2D
MTALSERRAGGTDVARLRPVRAGVSARAGIWLAALAPIAFLPGLEDRWSWPKLVLAVAALLFAVLAPATGRLPRSVLIGGAVVLAVIVLCAALGAAPLEQLLGRAPRYAGLVGLLPIAATVWTGARLLGPRADALAQATYLRACTVAAVALAAVAVLETFGARPIASDLDRPGSLAGNATDQGILGVILLAVTASVLIGSFRRVGRVSGWAATGAAAGVVAVATSASRAALLAMAIVLVALGIRWIAGSRRRLRDGLIAALVVLFALAVAFLLPLTRDRVLSATGLAGQTVGDRLQIWAAAVRVWQRSPWFGVGPGGFMDAVTRDLPAAWYRTTDPSTVLDSTHNLALQVLVDLGAVGAAVVVAVVVFCSRLAVRGVVAASGSRRDLLLGGAVAVLAAGVALLTTPASPTTLLPLAMLAGALLAAPA